MVNQEAIDILTDDEHIVSWLKEKCENKHGDQYHRDSVEIKPDHWVAIYYWLPRFGDFVLPDGLLEQAGATYISYETGRRGPRLLIGKGPALIGKGPALEDLWHTQWDSKQPLLACAQALKWLLSEKEKEEEGE